VKSRSDKQLRYKEAAHLTKDCEPERHGADGTTIVPCGLIAWSLFNDTYTVSVNKKAVEVNKKNIAWQSDKNKKFGSDVYPSNFQKGNLIGGAKLNESIPVREIVPLSSTSHHRHFMIFVLDLVLNCNIYVSS
jgi:hypothetical protein